MIVSGVAFVAGVASWGVLEYLIHRFLGHAPNAKLAFAVEHRRHHAQGDYFAPAAKKAIAAVPVIGGTYLLFTALLGVEVGVPLGTGLLLMYLAYEVFHRRLHTHPPTGAYGRWARRHHFHHHFGDPKENHGVTTPIGDLLFGTRRVPEKIRVPEKLAMVWLIDPQTREIRPEHRGDYELARLKAAQRPSAEPSRGTLEPAL